MGYVADPTVAEPGFIEEGRWEIEIAGERVPAKAQLASFYDPKRKRVRL
jgi:4-methylaminobutanoate oxidase (formaldehyde-forming)